MNDQTEKPTPEIRCLSQSDVYDGLDDDDLVGDGMMTYNV